MSDNLEVHEHCFVSGPRSKSGYGADGKWHSCGEKIRHSHSGGSIPHTHPHTGPSFYGYRAPKTTKRPTGEQGLEIIPRTEEESAFELVITDSAKLSGEIPIGDIPIEEIFMPAANRMMSGFRLNCIVRDERKVSGA